MISVASAGVKNDVWRGGETGSAKDIELRPRGERGRIRSRFDTLLCRSPSSTQFVGEGRGGGGPPSRTSPSEAPGSLPYLNLPRQFRGGGPVVPARRGPARS